MKEETTGFVEIKLHFEREILSAPFEGYGLVSVICDRFGWFQGGKDWFRLVSARSGSFLVVSDSSALL